MYCTKCGNQVSPETKYCTKCGAKIQPKSGIREPSEQHQNRVSEKNKKQTAGDRKVPTTPAPVHQPKQAPQEPKRPSAGLTILIVYSVCLRYSLLVLQFGMAAQEKK